MDPFQTDTGPALKGEIVEACLAMGFAAAGVCAARPSDYEGEFREWLDAGKHGEMSWLGDTVAERLSIDQFLPGAKSVLVVADQYAAAGDSAGVCEHDAQAESIGRTQASESRATGRIARYAVGTDYHKVIAKRLHRLADELRRRCPHARFRTFVDAAPVLEREHAVRAGLGWMGKHTLLIRPGVGSYLLLGGVATTLGFEELGGTESVGESGGGTVTDHCGSCTRCIDACPTAAISERSVDASRCISYLTIERETPIEPALHGAIGEWLLGCDVCQEVCPFNQGSVVGNGGVVSGFKGSVWDRVNPAYASSSTRISARLDLLAILGWGAAERATALSSTAVKRATLDVLKRNALIVLGNVLIARRGCDPVFEAAAMARVREVSESTHEPELLRVTAHQVLDRLAAAGTG